MKARDTAKKFCLQTRSKLAVRREKIESIFQPNHDIEFLDLETSLAVWSQIIHCRVARPYPYSGYLDIKIEKNFDFVVSTIASLMAAHKDQEVFCFTDDWRRRGVFIVQFECLATTLPKLMFAANDWLKIYTPNLKNAIVIDGDRTGSWDRLNDLDVSVLGQDWIDRLKLSGLTFVKPQ